MRTGRFRKQQAHGIPFIAKGRLDTDKDIAKFLAIDYEILSITIEITRGGSPILFEIFGIRCQIIIFFGTHFVFNIQLGTTDACFGIIQDGFHNFFFRVGGLTNIIPFRFQLSQHGLNGIKDIEVGGGTDISFVGGKGKDRNGNFLVFLFFVFEIRPFEGTIRQQIDTIRERYRSTGGTIPTGKNDRFNGTINFRQRHLEGDLNGMETQFRGLPFFKGLKHKRDGTHVRDIQVFEDFRGLLVILRGGTTNQGKAREVDDSIDNGFAITVLKEIFDRTGIIQATTVDRDDACTTGFQFGNQRHIMGIILGIDM
mmetsp:Transcript_39753/g.44384  ORF Transcript_39753/g.44384 Transcript_39753/m.44384 type:complete len:312 (-) Transcript_39753:1319-2254(-)